MNDENTELIEVQIIKDDFKLRRGTIRISYEVFHNEPRTIQKLFQKVTPYQIEYSYRHCGFIIFCLSDMFEVVEDGCLAPMYSVNEVINAKGELEFEFINLEGNGK